MKISGETKKIRYGINENYIFIRDIETGKVLDAFCTEKKAKKIISEIEKEKNFSEIWLLMISYKMKPRFISY